MPNWMNNRIEIIGTDEQIQELKEKLKPEYGKDGKEYFIDFKKILPLPENHNNDEINELWGTKWNACDQESKDNWLSFRTAWSYVPNIVSKISLNFPDVTLLYSFGDLAKWGKHTYCNGVLLSEEYGETTYQ